MRMRGTARGAARVGPPHAGPTCLPPSPHTRPTAHPQQQWPLGHSGPPSTASPLPLAPHIVWAWPSLGCVTLRVAPGRSGSHQGPRATRRVLTTCCTSPGPACMVPACHWTRLVLCTQDLAKIPSSNLCGFYLSCFKHTYLHMWTCSLSWLTCLLILLGYPKYLKMFLFFTSVEELRDSSLTLLLMQINAAAVS